MFAQGAVCLLFGFLLGIGPFLLDRTEYQSQNPRYPVDFESWNSEVDEVRGKARKLEAKQLPLDHGLLPEAFIWANDHFDFGIAIGQMFRSQIHERINGDETLQRLIAFCKVILGDQFLEFPR